MSNQLRLFMKRFSVLLGLCWLLQGCQTLYDPTTPSIGMTKPYTQLTFADKNYAELQKALPLYEAAVLHPWQPLPQTAKLKPWVKSPIVISLRERLIATRDLLPEEDNHSMRYDATVIDAVKHFQSRHGILADGIVGSDTLFELNVAPADRLNQIKVNMQRWARLSGDLDSRFIFVNVPAYRLDVIENDQRIMSMKAVVGKPSRPTPEINSTITRLVFNPYWNVPKLIAQEDIVPKALRDPSYLDAIHMRILDRQTDEAYEISPEEIDWQDAREQGFQYHFRQDPGPDNALGMVKFEFQNTDDIYMHDTPAKNLFNEKRRAYSSGCIRIERPYDLVNYLMETAEDWNVEKLQEYLDLGKPKYVKTAKPTKVIITYLTTWADDGGNLQFRDDIYGLDNMLY